MTERDLAHGPVRARLRTYAHRFQEDWHAHIEAGHQTGVDQLAQLPLHGPQCNPRHPGKLS